MKHYSNGPSPIKQDTLAMSLTGLKRIADVSNNEKLHINHLLPFVDGYCLKMSARLFSKCSMIRGHHRCKERLTRVSQRHSQGAQGQPSRSRASNLTASGQVQAENFPFHASPILCRFHH